MGRRTRVGACIAGLSIAGLVVLPATAASAAPPQGKALSVTCPSGSGTCTRYGYTFTIPGATGNFTIYYTVRWSSSGGSYKVVKVNWVNGTNKTVCWGGYGIHNSQLGYGALGLGTTSCSYYLGAGKSYAFVESQFNGGAKGVYTPKRQGAYSSSQENVTTWRYHVSGNGSITGAFLLG